MHWMHWKKRMVKRMRVNEKFSTSWASSSVNPSGLISKCVFSRTAGYSETIVDEIVPKAYDLDRLFFVKHGEKNLVRWFESIDTSVSQNCLYCSDMVATMYNNKWTRLYESMVMSIYDPIQNYKMRETEEYEGDDLHTGTDSNSLTHGESVTNTYNSSVETEHDTEDKMTYNTEEETEYDTEEKTTLNSTFETEYDTEEETEYDTEQKTTYNSDVETKTNPLGNGDTVETEIDSTDPAKTTNKVFGFNSTADAGVMDSISINTGSSKQTTKKDDIESHSGYDQTDKDGTDTVTKTGKDTLTKSGFDKVEKSGTDTDSKTGTETMDHTGTDTTSKTGHDTEAHSGTDSGSNTYNSNMNKTFERELNREGNIGVTSSQQMLEQEIELRKKMFYEIMMQDLCEMFCIPIY